MALTAAVAAPRPRWLPIIGLMAIPAKSWMHALSTTIAAVLALYVAFTLELDSPGSAAVTVLIVSSPLSGMVLSKSIWRMVGTSAGVLVSILLIALFAQSPVGFLVSLALWLGLCTFISSLLRYFRAYAAVLAGYTIGIVALPASADPEQIFDLASNRIAVVAVGVLCMAVVKSLFALKVGPRRLRPLLEGALAPTVSFAAQALDLQADLPARRRAVAEGLTALDPLIVSAANENAQTAQQTQAVRLFVSLLISVVTLASSVRDEVAALPEDGMVAGAITPLRHMVRDLLRGITSGAVFVADDTGRSIAAARRAAAVLSDDLALAISSEILEAIGLATRLEDLLEQLETARTHLVAIEQGRVSRDLTPVSYHRDAHDAVINGMRAATAALLAGAFWIATAWSSGSVMLSIMLPVCALLGTLDRPDLASLGFARGAMAAAVCSFFCEFFMLAPVDGFPLMAVMISPFLIIGVLLSTIPKHAGSATAFGLLFSTFLGLRNPMVYDMGTFLNTIVAIVTGTFFAVLAFQLLWPVNPAKDIRRLIVRLRADLVALAASGRRPPVLSVWKSTMHDRLSRLSTRLANSPDRAAVVEGGIAAIYIGQELMRARRLMDGLTLPPMAAQQVDGVRRALGGRVVDFDIVAAAANTAAHRLVAAADAVMAERQLVRQELAGQELVDSEAAGGDMTQDEAGDRARAEAERAAAERAAAAMHACLLRLAAAFHEIARLLIRHRDFFMDMPAAGPAAVRPLGA